MVRRKKDQPPMKTHTIRMTDAEWSEMQRCAEIADESDSEYIRKAVEQRNAQYKTRNKHSDEKTKQLSRELPSDGLRFADTPTGKPIMVQSYMKGEKK